MKIPHLGETPNSLGEVLLAAARRSTFADSEWHACREQLCEVWAAVSTNPFAASVSAELQTLLGPVPEPQVHKRHRSKKRTLAQTLQTLSGPNRTFESVPYVSKRMSRFRCTHCGWVHTRRTDRLSRDGALACLCESSPYPLRGRDCGTRAVNVDYKNLKRLVRARHAAWKLSSSEDAYENSQATVLLTCVKCQESVPIRPKQLVLPVRVCASCK